MTIFKLKMDFSSANSGFGVQNDGTYLSLRHIYRKYRWKPGVNFINILGTTFLPIFWSQKIAKPNIIREKLLNSLLYKKRVRKMLLKLTPVESNLFSMTTHETPKLWTLLTSVFLKVHLYYESSK